MAVRPGRRPNRFIFLVFWLVLGCGSLPALTSRARAEELRPLYRGARAQAMGGAFSAVADDEEAIFINPAGLAGVKKMEIHYAPLVTEFSTDMLTNYQSTIDAFQNFSLSSINTLYGNDVYGRAQIAPSLIAPNFGFSVLVDQQVALLMHDQAQPQITVGYQTTNGIQGAWGISVLKKKRNSSNDLRVGVAGKILWRRGGYHLLPLNTMLNLSTDTLHEITGDFQMGIGMDVGTQYVKKFSDRFSASLAATYLDIGDTNFGGQASPQKGNFTLGGALTYRMTRTKVVLSYDYQHLLDAIPWQRKNHLGFELAMPVFSIYGGLNEMMLTYGVAFDLWVFRMTAVSYAEEQGTYVGQDPQRRYLLQLDLKF